MTLNIVINFYFSLFPVKDLVKRSIKDVFKKIPVIKTERDIPK